MGRFLKIAGGVIVTLATIGVLANLPDIKRYVRMTMM